MWLILRAYAITKLYFNQGLSISMTVLFPKILLVLLFASFFIMLVDQFFWRKARENAGGKMPVMVDYARSFLPVFFIVIVIRSFLFQPYKVPTGSLEPTVQPVEYLLVSQFAYGLRLPVWRKKILSIGTPQRGDIALFHWPVNTNYVFVKRVLGLPGDHISYINKTFYINGKKIKRTFVRNAKDYANDTSGPGFSVQIWEENLLGVKHKIFINPSIPGENFKDLVVPKGQYLMIGDNRDNSDDGRYFGFVPINNFVGKAVRVFFSWDSHARHIRWHRIWTSLEPR